MFTYIHIYIYIIRSDWWSTLDESLRGQTRLGRIFWYDIIYMSMSCSYICVYVYIYTYMCVFV